MAGTTPLNIVEFSRILGKLKHLKRTGWVKKGINNPENVAGHMYRMSMFSMVLDPELGLNKHKCMKMSLVHDLAEAIVGDITPHCGVGQEEKYRREKCGLEEITALVPELAREEIVDLWNEYEEGTTNEAKMVKDLDKFDMISQAFEYEQDEKKNGFLQEFFDSTQGYFQTDTVKQWAEDLKNARKQQK